MNVSGSFKSDREIEINFVTKPAPWDVICPEVYFIEFLKFFSKSLVNFRRIMYYR